MTKHSLLRIYKIKVQKTCTDESKLEGESMERMLHLTTLDYMKALWKKLQAHFFILIAICL